MSETIEPLQVLVETAGDVKDELSPELRRLYGGPLGLNRPTVYANFVSAVDGTVALPALERSNKLISAGSEADRFVMGLLRALADVILVGAGTLNASPTGTWAPGRAHPPSASALAELREQRGLPELPELAVLTGSGSIDHRHPALERALILTSTPGEARLRRRVSGSASIVALSADEWLSPREVIAALRERGHRAILFEAGPTAFGAFAAASAIDELFLTLSPLLAGGVGSERLTLVEGVQLLPERRVDAQLLTLRRDGDHLFLRYRLTPPLRGA